jgi:rod shape-determining protein MreD
MTLLALLQSTLIQKLAVLGVIPDLALVALIYVSIRNGSMEGQLSGFLSGFSFDFISSAPLGFNILIRTLIGYLYGLIKGKLFIDAVIGPFLMAFIATLMKAGLAALLGLFFPGSLAPFHVLGRTILIEALYNAVCAPFLFLILRLFDRLLISERPGR